MSGLSILRASAIVLLGFAVGNEAPAERPPASDDKRVTIENPFVKVVPETLPAPPQSASSQQQPPAVLTLPDLPAEVTDLPSPPLGDKLVPLDQPVILLPTGEPVLLPRIERSSGTGGEGLALPAWLLPDGLGEETRPADPSDSSVELASATSPLVPRRGAALYAQADKIARREEQGQKLTLEAFDDIIELCEIALTEKPRGEIAQSLRTLAGWAYNRRGEMLAAKGNEREAFDDFQRAIKADRNCWGAFHNRAITLARYGRYQEALGDFNTAIELNPEYVTAYRNRGELLLSLGRNPEAVADLSVALEHQGESVELYSLRALAYQQSGQYDRAVRDCNRVLEADPYHAVAYARRGNVYAEIGYYEQATLDLNQSLALDPHCAIAYRSVAWLLATCPDARYRDAARAVEAAERAVRFSSKAEDPVLLDIRAAAHANAGDFTTAIPLAEQAVLLGDQSDRAAYRARVELYRQNRPYRASPSPAASTTGDLR